MAGEDRFDIDLGAIWRALTRNWLIILILIAIGVVAAVGVTLARGKEYQDASAVYLGQPTDANGNAINGINSNPRGAEQIVKSSVVLNEAVDQIGGISVTRLRSEITVAAPTTTVRSVSAPTTFVTITVRDPSAARAVKSANVLADLLVTRINTYSIEKIALLEKEITDHKAHLESAEERVQTAQDALTAVSGSSVSATEKAASTAAYLAVLQSATTQRDTLVDRLRNAELSLLVARDVEQPYVFSKASLPATRVTPGMVLAGVAGAVAGLVVGIAAALVRERVRRPKPAV